MFSLHLCISQKEYANCNIPAIGQYGCSFIKKNIYIVSLIILLAVQLLLCLD